MVVTAHIECPICGGSFGVWCQSQVETATCPYCMTTVSVGCQVDQPLPKKHAGGWLTGLLTAATKLPLLVHNQPRTSTSGH